MTIYSDGKQENSGCYVARQLRVGADWAEEMNISSRKLEVILPEYNYWRMIDSRETSQARVNQTSNSGGTRLSIIVDHNLIEFARDKDRLV